MTASQIRPLGRAWIEHVGIFVAFFALAIVLTYPVALSPDQAIPIDPQIDGWFPGDGDPWHYLWGIWYVGRAFATFPPPLLWTDLVFFPVGFDMPFLPGVGLILGPGALLEPFFGLVLTYNLLWGLSFALAGYAMYLLARHLLGDRNVAFVCGTLFTFSSYRLIHSVEHLPIVMASFLVPLFALALLRVAESPTLARSAACALVLAASAGISWYCTVSLLVCLGVAVLVFFWQHGLRSLGSIPPVPVLGGLVVLVVAASPFVLPLALSPARDSIVDRPLIESSLYSADLLAFFVPSPRNPVFGALTGPVYQRFTGNPYEQTVYLGYASVALALLGVVVAPTTARLFRVTALTAFVLALGPFLQVAGKVTSLPLPYLLLHYIPIVRGARVPSRFTELLLMALIVLAGYGLSHLCARMSPRRRLGLAVVVLVTALLETTLAPLPVLSTGASTVYDDIRRSGEMATVLELPLDMRIIKYHYYQTIHGQRMLGGNPVRPREKYDGYPQGIPLIPYLRDPTLLLDQGDPENARQDAERLAAFFDVRHVVIHSEYLDPRVLERLDRFVAANFAHVSRRVDGTVVAYTLRDPQAAHDLWPDRVFVDFGASRQEFVLLTGWSQNERWGDGGPTMQWARDGESSLVVGLGDPVDRVLELRVHPLAYEGAPQQTLNIDVNGVRTGLHVLDAGWNVLRVALPATSFRTGRNTVTFRYNPTAVPARVVPGSSDARRLGVAFDYLALTPSSLTATSPSHPNG